MNQAELLKIIRRAAQTKQTSLDLSRIGLRENSLPNWGNCPT